MLIYLADLYHNYLQTRQHVPLGVGYIGEYLKAQFPGKLEIVLFKSADKLLDSIDARVPDVVGLSNYTWNDGLNQFVGPRIKGLEGLDIPIVMGGPNIRGDEDGVTSFLKAHDYVDRYAMYSGERPMAEIIRALFDQDTDQRDGNNLRAMTLASSYALNGETLSGGAVIEDEKSLDFVPSPYMSGALDEFLDTGFLPIIETNRGCPFSCTFCVWGISALSKLKQFSLERVRAELDYIGKSDRTFSEIVFADANFGILKRDVDISQYIRDLYDAHKSFQAVQIYWSKSAQPHMVEIGKILGHLTHTYVAFQSLDPIVLEAIKRKNISTDKLVKLINDLKSYTHSTQTDLLVGLPNENFDSHLRSLEGALRYGINLIQGGEIRLLPGSEMDSPSSRDQYQIKTKYRLCEGQYGLYRGELVCEFEEVIRQTETMTEEEMLQLRVLRTIFFASVTLGEHRPLINYLVKNDVPVIDFFKLLAQSDAKYPAFNRALAWCVEQARQEWFETIESAHQHFEAPDHRAELFGDNPFLKLNYGMLARLIGNQDEYQDFCKKTEDTLLQLIPGEDPTVLKEIVQLCQARNFVYGLLHNGQADDVQITLSPATRNALAQAEYPAAQPETKDDGSWVLSMDPLTKKTIAEKNAALDGDITILAVSQILEQVRGRSYLEPTHRP